MSTLIAVYSRSATLGGLLLRYSDRWGGWSHCGVVTPQNTIIEARAFHGVVESSMAEFVGRCSHCEFTRIDVPDADAGVAWAREQLGKPYDYGAVAGNLFRESWQDDDKWECSELLEGAVAKAGRPRFRQQTWRISPNLSWSVL